MVVVVTVHLTTDDIYRTLMSTTFRYSKHIYIQTYLKYYQGQIQDLDLGGGRYSAKGVTVYRGAAGGDTMGVSYGDGNPLQSGGDKWSSIPSEGVSPPH